MVTARIHSSGLGLLTDRAVRGSLSLTRVGGRMCWTGTLMRSSPSSCPARKRSQIRSG